MAVISAPTQAAPSPVTSNGCTVVSFTSVGSDSWTTPSDVHQVDVVVVAGGGGGGGGAWAGGGGAGGVLFGSALSVTPGQAIAVTVGAGGNGGASSLSEASNQGTSGGNSAFGAAVAKGGGGGGGYAWQFPIGTDPATQFARGYGLPGGSAGGHGELNTARSATASNQDDVSGFVKFGNSGGAIGAQTQTGSGGGGATADGGDATSSRPGNGGNGKAFTIAGTQSTFGGGGGGGGNSSVVGGSGGTGGGGTGGRGNTAPPTGGAANTGGGGGGSGFGSSGTSGAAGGSGVVIVSYPAGCIKAADFAFLTLNSAIGGESSTASPLSIAPGGSSSLVATAQTGYTFASWSCTGGTLSSAGSSAATLSNITGDVTCTPAFTSSQPSYDVTMNQSAGGLISASPETVSAGGSATLTANASPDFEFSSWACSGGTMASSTANPTTLTNITTNVSCSATFSPLAPEEEEQEPEVFVMPMLALESVILQQLGSGQPLSCSAPKFAPEATTVDFVWLIDGVEKSKETFSAQPWKSTFAIPAGTAQGSTVTCWVTGRTDGFSSTIGASYTVTASTTAAPTQAPVASCRINSAAIAVTFAANSAVVTPSALRLLQSSTGSGCTGQFEISGHVKADRSTKAATQLARLRAQRVAEKLKQLHPQAQFDVQAAGAARATACPTSAKNRCAVITQKP